MASLKVNIVWYLKEFWVRLDLKHCIPNICFYVKLKPKYLSSRLSFSWSLKLNFLKLKDEKVHCLFFSVLELGQIFTKVLVGFTYTYKNHFKFKNIKYNQQFSKMVKLILPDQWRLIFLPRKRNILFHVWLDLELEPPMRCLRFEASKGLLRFLYSISIRNTIDTSPYSVRLYEGIDVWCELGFLAASFSKWYLWNRCYLKMWIWVERLRKWRFRQIS